MIKYSSDERKLNIEGKPGDILNEVCVMVDQTLKTLSAETKIPYDVLNKHFHKGLRIVRKGGK